jgi:hypothetical protein
MNYVTNGNSQPRALATSGMLKSESLAKARRISMFRRER